VKAAQAIYNKGRRPLTPAEKLRKAACNRQWVLLAKRAGWRYHPSPAQQEAKNLLQRIRRYNLSPTQQEAVLHLRGVRRRQHKRNLLELGLYALARLSFSAASQTQRNATTTETKTVCPS
jgi:hypothetical protein